ncbi:MAG TPA: beta-N-acetylglucosaminidase domain-containing protein [Planctomycetota bacterium]|nr:beta-N-acetylglucosaminidase domain-containing protein [Planctomycetota bacterium]
MRAQAHALALLVALSARAATLPLAQVVPDYMEADLETAIIPTPQEARLGDAVFPLGKVALVKPKGYRAPDTLAAELSKLAGAELVRAEDATTVVSVGDAAGRDLSGLPPSEDAYLLHTAAGKPGEKNSVLLAGKTPAADFWALATLRQMVFEKDGVRYVREGTLTDFPRFAYRGNKRPKPWEWRYKANYGWFFQLPVENPTRPGANFRWDYFRHHGAWVRHGDPLAATDEEMDALLASARDAYGAGCREFVLKFDDTGSKMSDATKARFGQDFSQALHHYLLGMHRRLKALDAANRIYFMPRPYWYNSFETAAYAKALLAHGPLPADIGLSVCGPEVISRVIPTACLKEYREVFGLKGKAQIYDNFGRGGDCFAYSGRDPDLWTEVCCIFPERGTPVTRITVYDYLWNPEAYDPKRSLQLAVRELAAGKPEVYAPLLDYVRLYNERRHPSGYVAQAEAAELFRTANAALKAKYDALVPLLARSPMAVEVNLADELWGSRSPQGSLEVGEHARLRRRLDFEPYMVRCGWQETRVARAAEAPTIDGRLDEPAWGKAVEFSRFVQPAWGMKTPPQNPDALLLGGEEATRLRLLCTGTHLYVGIEFGYKAKPALPNWAASLWKELSPGQQGDYAWRVPCFELFLDPGGRREDYYQVISNIAGIWLSRHFGVYEPGRRGEPWRPDYRFAFTLGEKQGVFEAAIPFADLGAAVPRGGEAWGFQCFRSKIGAFGLFSGVYDLVGGDHAPSQFGRIVFE